MEYRLMSQYLALSLSILTVIGSVWYSFKRPAKIAQVTTWLLFGIVNTVYYVLILFAQLPGHNLSIARSTICTTLVAFHVITLNYEEFRREVTTWIQRLQRS